MWAVSFFFLFCSIGLQTTNEWVLLLAFCRSIQQFFTVTPFYQRICNTTSHLGWMEWNGKRWHPALSSEDVKLTQIYERKLFPCSGSLCGKPAAWARTRPHDVTSTKSFGRARCSYVFRRRLNQSSADFHQCWWSFAAIRPKRKKVTIQLQTSEVDKLKASVWIDLFALGKLITQLCFLMVKCIWCALNSISDSIIGNTWANYKQGD